MVADSPPPPPLPLPPRPPPPLLPPPLSNQPQPHSPNLSSARRIPAFLAFLAFLAAGAGGAATVALCHSGLDHRVGGKESTELVVRGERKRVPQEFVDELASFLVENLTVDYEERCFHGKPQNSFHRAVNVPDVIVFPRSQDEVQKIVMTCNKYESFISAAAFHRTLPLLRCRDGVRPPSAVRRRGPAASPLARQSCLAPLSGRAFLRHQPSSPGAGSRS